MTTRNKTLLAVLVWLLSFGGFVYGSILSNETIIVVCGIVSIMSLVSVVMCNDDTDYN